MITPHIRRHARYVLYALCMLLVSLSVAGAIQVDKTVIYKGGNMGRIVFDGRTHNEVGYHCMKCHYVYFMPKKARQDNLPSPYCRQGILLRMP